ncbi:hypothetical protein PVAP13_8NG335600 [Panicum virgatum]|uniref:Uncharacterized protein n=1 Tax=Panicum virgatum TaxID=38727 RepID=A0A8T0PBS3_PANVG|nr:hypothetical protein PVAP13_8NG335600 [Panicum virgatum]
MAAAAVLRSAGGALRRRPSAFPHALLGKQQQPQLMHRSPPVENVTPHRRLYSSDRDVIKAEVNKIIPEATILQRISRISKNFDKLDQIYAKQLIALDRLEEVIQENIKRDRRRKVLVRGFILIGIAIFVKKQFFGASQEDKAVSDST